MNDRVRQFMQEWHHSDLKICRVGFKMAQQPYGRMIWNGSGDGLNLQSGKSFREDEHMPPFRREKIKHPAELSAENKFEQQKSSKASRRLVLYPLSSFLVIGEQKRAQKWFSELKK